MVFYLVHIAFWVLVAGGAWLSAGSYSLASCWTVAVVFPTPYALIFWAAIAVLLVVSVAKLGRFFATDQRPAGALAVPIHFAIALVGISAELVSAQMSSPKPSCL